MDEHSQKPKMAPISSRGIMAEILCWFLALTVPILPPPISGAQEQGSAGFSISKKVALAVLPVTVRDRAGHFVSGLQASNFRIFEDGRPQNITLFRQEDVPVTVGLVVDHSGSMAARQVEVIAGAQAFVRASNPQNREFVVNFGKTASFALPSGAAFSSDLEQLVSALSTPYATGTTALYDAVGGALKHAAEDDLPKKILLLVSDGGDNASQDTLAQALRAAQASNVVIYAIGLLDEHSADQNPGVLRKLASDTGGQAYFPSSLSEVVGVCQQIAVDVRAQYTLGYSPPDTEPAGYHKLRVEVVTHGRGRLLVRTRPGYFSPGEAPSSTIPTGSEDARGHR